jgi:hypothetical protein
MWVVFLKPVSIAWFKHDAGEMVELDERRADHYTKLGYCEPCAAPVKAFDDFVKPDGRRGRGRRS